MSLAENIFLRFYAANLSRAKRGDPASACADAVLQMAALGGVLATTIYVGAGLLMARSLLSNLYEADWSFIAVAGSSGAALGLWARRSFFKYRNQPEAALPYRGKASIRWVNILYVALPIAWAWAMGFALQLLDTK